MRYILHRALLTCAALAILSPFTGLTYARADDWRPNWVPIKLNSTEPQPSQRMAADGGWPFCGTIHFVWSTPTNAGSSDVTLPGEYDDYYSYTDTDGDSSGPNPLSAGPNSSTGTYNYVARFKWAPIWQGAGEAPEPPPAPANARFKIHASGGGYRSFYYSTHDLAQTNGSSAELHSAMPLVGINVNLTGNLTPLPTEQGFFVSDGSNQIRTVIVSAPTGPDGIAVINVSATTTAYSTSTTLCSSSVECRGGVGGTVSVEIRAPFITSDIEPTYHRTGPAGAGVQVANARVEGSDSVYQDTLKPTPRTLPFIPNYTYITYSPHFGAGWSEGSTWNLNSSKTGTNEQGIIFFPENIICEYVDDTFTYQTVGEDHVHLSVTDSVDGAVATDNYYMRFHDTYEDPWFNDGYRAETHPIPLDPDNLDTWELLVILTNHSDTDTVEHLTTEKKWTRTDSGDISGDTGELPKILLRFHAGIKWGEDTEAKVGTDVPLTAFANSRTYWYGSQTWAHVYGKVATYNQNGYAGDTEWNGIQASEARSVDYTTYPL